MIYGGDSMIEIWLMEIGKGLLWLLGQPLLYWAVIVTMIASFIRIKQERKTFGIRVFPIGFEWKGTLATGLTAGVILSAGLILAGGVLPFSFLLFISLVTILLSIAGRLFLSPAYLFGLSILVVWIISSFNLIPSDALWLTEWEKISQQLLILFMVLLLAVEGLLARRVKRNETFPKLIKGKRGKFVGQHLVRKLSVVPVLVPVPSGRLELTWDWWPLFPVEGQGISLMLVPLLIGFEQTFQGSFADEGARKHGNWLLILSVFLGAVAYASFYFSFLVPVAAVTAILGKLLIHLWIRFADLEKVPVFSPELDSLPILGVMPGSPADDMGLMVGEKIMKVNQIPVTNEHEFYQALQKNRTYIKLEVLNLEGEPRFVQRAMYEGEHHELGLIFVKEKPKFKLYSVQEESLMSSDMSHTGEG